jgi:large subunit ribosomal protein L23
MNVARKPVLSRSRMYELVRRPVITEKSTNGSTHGQVTFEVPIDASKPEIRAAVEGLFNVKVKAVNTIVVGGKKKVFRGIRGRRSDWKKAVVSLAEGSKIDVTTGL